MNRLRLNLKTKMTIGVCLLVAGMMAVLGFYSLSYFQKQLRENVAVQQFVLISAIAGHIDDNLVVAQNELIAMAKSVPSDILQNGDRIQNYLNTRPDSKTTFDNSIVLLNREGTLIAETPFAPGRRGKNYSFRDYFKKTVASGKPTISEPFFSEKKHRHPIVMLTAPLFNTAGEVTGMLTGSIDLTHHNFLGKLADFAIGKSGYLFMFNKDRTVIMHPDEKRILTRDVQVGVNISFDRAVAGFEGTEETINSKGLPVLVSYKHLTATNWVLAANLPQAEAYAAIHQARSYLVFVFLAAIALSVGFVWFYMKHLTAPLTRFASHVRSFTDKRGEERFFVNVSGDEIGVLAEVFNGMVNKLDNEQAALRESEERFRQIAEYSQEVFSLFSSDLSRIIYINPAYENIWQLSCQSLYENPLSFTDSIHEGDRTRVLTALEQLVAHGDIYDQTFRIVRPDLSMCWIHARTYPVHSASGEITRYVGIAEDVTKQKLVEEQIRKLHQDVEQAHAKLKTNHVQFLQQEKMASIGQLAAGVAHEINNPVAFVVSNLGTLNKYLGRMTNYFAIQVEKLAVHAPPDVVQELDNLKKSLKLDYIMVDAKQLVDESLDGAERVRIIVQNLKSFSRMDDTEIKMVNINSCIESTLNIAWNELKYKATLKKDLVDIPLTKCNPQQLNQVFLNLLINAAHSIDEQGEVGLSSRCENGYILVTVSDTGCGIPEANLERVFEPFFTTKEVGKGTGLGLSICYDIIRKHNGDILIESEVGKGTVFTVRLPVVEEK